MVIFAKNQKQMNAKFIVLFLFFQFMGYSQEEFNHKYFWETEKKEAIIAVKNCYVRSEPHSASKLIDSLQLGEKISIVNSTENLLKIKNINTNWAEIEYTNSKEKIVKGYLWKGFLALGFVKNHNLTFLTRIDRFFEKFGKNENVDFNVFQISVLVLDEKNQVLSEKSIYKNVLESHYFENKKIGSLGLIDLQDIYRVSFSGQACGIPTYYFYFGWNGKDLVILPEKMEVADAGVFYYSEKFIFPKENGGKANFIFKEVEEQEVVDENKAIYDVTKFIETYKWDGNKAFFVNKTKSKKVRKKLI